MTIYGLIHYQLLIKPAKSLSNDLGDLRTIMKGWWSQMRRLPAQMVTCLGIPGENQDQTAEQHTVPTYQTHQHISSSVCSNCNWCNHLPSRQFINSYWKCIQGINFTCIIWLGARNWLAIKILTRKHKMLMDIQLNIYLLREDIQMSAWSRYLIGFIHAEYLLNDSKLYIRQLS